MKLNYERGRSIQALIVLLLLACLAAPALYAQTANVTLENTAGHPSPDRLVFSRIGNLSDPPPENGVHDVTTLRIRNEGGEAFQIDTVTVSGPFQVDDLPEFPATVAPEGGAIDLIVRFTGASGDLDNSRRGHHAGTLSIESGDLDDPITVGLAGYWQRRSQGGLEPELDEIIEQLFGYGTKILFPGQSIDTEGRVETVGDEILSPYWVRAEAHLPVSVHPLAAFYECCTHSGTLAWYEMGNPDGAAQILALEAPDGQTVLPRIVGGERPAMASFTPDAETIFGFIKDDDHWSDPLLNDLLPDDDCSAGRETCGHRMRFFPMKDATGELVSNAYILAAENGRHYDYNDGVYLVSNVAPAEGSVAVEDRMAELPSEFALESYPNPFNPRATIRYALPEVSEVRLEVFDTLGRRIALLVDGMQTAGQHEIPFIAEGLTSGIYVARMSAGSLTKTHVLFLVK